MKLCSLYFLFSIFLFNHWLFNIIFLFIFIYFLFIYLNYLFRISILFCDSQFSLINLTNFELLTNFYLQFTANNSQINPTITLFHFHFLFILICIFYERKKYRVKKLFTFISSVTLIDPELSKAKTTEISSFCWTCWLADCNT